MSRDVDAVMAKAVEAAKVIKELQDLAAGNGFGCEMDYEGNLIFEDWQSSDCYGEGNAETFGVRADGTLWVPSNC